MPHSQNRKRNHSTGNVGMSQTVDQQRSKKPKSKVTDSDIDSAINAVLSQPCPTPTTSSDGACGAGSGNGRIAMMQSQITHLQSVVSEQSAEITRLTTQLSFVMSYLGVQDVGNETAVSVTGPSPAVQDNGSSAVITRSTQSTAGKVSVARSSAVRAAAVTAAVAAVYVDQSVKKRRASTLIVSGLPIVNSASDQQQFINLCQSEFDIQPDVVHTRRLGQVKPGRVQPLMVALRTEDAASQLIGRARQLRRSTDVFVRSNVYINENLTRAEANAAYQLRESRRRRRQQTSASSSANGSSARTSQSCAATDIAVPSSAAAVSSNTASGLPAVAGLNPSAVPYQPAPSSI